MDIQKIQERLETKSFLKLMTVMMTVMLILVTMMFFGQKTTTLELCKIYCTDVHGHGSMAISSGNDCKCAYSSKQKLDFKLNLTVSKIIKELKQGLTKKV